MMELNRVIGALTGEVRGLRGNGQDVRAVSARYRQGIRNQLAKIMRQPYVETDVSLDRANVDDMNR